MTRLATLWGKVWPRRLRHRALLLLVAVTLPTMLALVHLSVQRQEAMAMDSASRIPMKIRYSMAQSLAFSASNKACSSGFSLSSTP